MTADRTWEPSVVTPKSKPAMFTPAYLHWVGALVALELVLVVDTDLAVVDVVAADEAVPGIH